MTQNSAAKFVNLFTKIPNSSDLSKDKFTGGVGTLIVCISVGIVPFPGSPRWEEEEEQLAGVQCEEAAPFRSPYCRTNHLTTSIILPAALQVNL
ncbi:hypothetical protein MHYP_G00073040 [Metynnis hypsauchen]